MDSQNYRSEERKTFATFNEYINAEENKFQKKFFEEYLAYLKEIHKPYIADFLLKRESEEENVPLSQYFDVYRHGGRHSFEIPFKTEKYQSWWKSTTKSTDVYVPGSDGYCDIFLRDCGTGDYDAQKKLAIEGRNFVVTHILLDREIKNKSPPNWRFNDLKASFDIPFETKQYIDWWCKGPSSLDELRNSESLDHFGDDLNPDNKEKCEQMAIMKYLLEMEILNDSPPKRFSFKRNQFEIPFQTQAFQEWWTTDLEIIGRQFDWPDPFMGGGRKELCIFMRYALMRESMIASPPKDDFWGICPGSFDIPFKTEPYKQSWYSNNKTEVISFTDWTDSNDVYEHLVKLLIETFALPNSFPLSGKTCSTAEFRNWLIEYLLEIECRGKSPPNSTFVDQRGRFEISFKTDEFQACWEGKTEMKEEEKDEKSSSETGYSCAIL